MRRRFLRPTVLPLLLGYECRCAARSRTPVSPRLRLQVVASTCPSLTVKLSTIHRWSGALPIVFPMMGRGRGLRFLGPGFPEPGTNRHRFRNPSNGDAPEDESGSFSVPPLKVGGGPAYAQGTLFDSV